MKAALSLFAVAVLLTSSAASVHGQSALDGFDPNANGFLIKLVVVQPDGKILIGGDFTTLSPNGGVPVTRNRIARLNPDGLLDTNFNPNADGTVYAIAVQADGKILAGGVFTNIGGQVRNCIARLDSTTGLADSFNPNANGVVNSIAVQADGKILAGGVFTNIGGQARNYIARLDAANGLADSFDPNANGVVNSIAVQADGRILAGGGFSGVNSIGGQTRNFIARLDATTGLADSFNPNASNAVLSIAVQADGKILAGGSFTNIGGQARNRIARLDPTTGLADSFNPDANWIVYSIVVQTDGKILVGGEFGSFFGPISIGGQLRNGIARLDPTTGLADSFSPTAITHTFLDDYAGSVYAIAVQADGKIVAGGAFNRLVPNGGGGAAAVSRNNIARLETDGRVDQTLNLSIITTGLLKAVYATAVQPDGKILIGGVFISVLGVTRNNMARLNTDGTLDTAFNPNPNANGEVYAIAVQADGKILVAGTFTNIGGQARNYIARLDAANGLADSFNPNAKSNVHAIAVQADGKILVGGVFKAANSIGGEARNRIARLDAATGLADAFNPNANDDVYAIAVQADGKILAGGSFTNIGGEARNRMARLEAATGLADSFNPNANDDVYAIAVQADGKILAGGGFNGAISIGGEARNRMARLDPATGLADSFNPNANGEVYAIAVQADGKIMAGGSFSGATSIGGETRNYVARLDATTGLADSFDPNANDSLRSIVLQADGKILAGGRFSNIGGQPRNLFARLNNDTVALQRLAVTPTTVIWIRAGSSPQFARVTFEDSTDNVNYTFLGNGMAAGSNWILTGLNLSTEQNLYIRARGYHAGGLLNGSQSIEESIRNVFLFPPPSLNIQRSTNSNIVLSWQTIFTGFTLEANSNLNADAWSAVLPAPTFSGTNNVVTNGISVPARYYRLRKDL